MATEDNLCIISGISAICITLAYILWLISIDSNFLMLEIISYIIVGIALITQWVSMCILHNIQKSRWS